LTGQRRRGPWQKDPRTGLHINQINEAEGISAKKQLGVVLNELIGWDFEIKRRRTLACASADVVMGTVAWTCGDTNVDLKKKKLATSQKISRDRVSGTKYSE
jgi:hypothetical protein